MDSPADFRIPGRDRLFHSPSAGSSPAGTSPFCLLHTCSNAACLTSTRTSGPSSCAPDDPAIIRIVRMVRKQWHLQRHTFFFFSFTTTQTKKTHKFPCSMCHLYNFTQFSFVLNKKCPTRFTKNPSLRTTFFLSASILLAVLCNTELCLFLPPQVATGRGGAEFGLCQCVTLLTPTAAHTHTHTPHSEASVVLQLPSSTTRGRTRSSRGPKWTDSVAMREGLSWEMFT